MKEQYIRFVGNDREVHFPASAPLSLLIRCGVSAIIVNGKYEKPVNFLPHLCSKCLKMVMSNDEDGNCPECSEDPLEDWIKHLS